MDKERDPAAAMFSLEAAAALKVGVTDLPVVVVVIALLLTAFESEVAASVLGVVEEVAFVKE